MSPYIGGKVADLYPSRPTRRAVRRMADRGGKELVKLVKSNTPISHPVPEELKYRKTKRRPGTLRRSIYQLPLREFHEPTRTGWQSGAATDDEVAPHVEWGTGNYGRYHRPYEIKPKRPGGFLFFWSRKWGKYVRTRRVMHPGSPGQAMFRLSAAKLEHTLDVVLDPELRRWKRDMESLP